MDKNTQEDIKEITKLRREDRRLQVAKLRQQGFQPAMIAQVLDIPVETVCDDLRSMDKEFLKSFQNITGAELLLRSYQFYEDMKDYAVREMRSSSKKVQKVVGKDGKTYEVEVADPNRAKFYAGALKAEELKNRLLLESGIIPRNQPEKLFEGLSDLKKQATEKTKEETGERTQEEILSSIDNLLKHSRTL